MKRFSKPTALPAASMAAPGWGFRSAVNWRACWEARSGSQSAPGIGSTFTLYLPQTYVTPSQPPKSEALKTTPVLLEQAAAVPEAQVDMILPSPPLDDQELRRGPGDR